MTRRLLPLFLVVAVFSTLPTVLSASPSFITFETGPVRPLALSPDGQHLFAVNTPDAQLEIFRIGPAGITHVGSVPVGLEPTAVAARGAQEVWVVNHLSDSVSIVHVPTRRVVRTLLVGDEPRDIVFARGRAFITTAHRGQHRTHPSIADVPGAGDPQLTAPDVPRADVWVFDARRPGDALGGRPLAIVELFGDTPRALAVSPDGNTVYAAVFHSGNQTTAISEGLVCNGFDPHTPCEVDTLEVPGGNPGPATDHLGNPAPEVGLIVRFNRDTGHWEDELGRAWDDAVRFDLPDKDVFAIDARTLEETAHFRHVGTILFNMAVNPQTGALYVSNTEARNEVRFEGPGQFAGSTVQGRLHEARITVIEDNQVQPRHLNKHIDYSIRPASPGTKQHSLATPLDMVVSRDGQTLYVAAFGSGTVGVLPTQALEQDTFDPTELSEAYVPLSGGGPAGLALDERRARLYVLTRFDNAISVIDTEARLEIAHVPLHNPEPAHVVEGRPILYDAQRTSSNGEASCAACHVFGDLDSLAWDLGNPDGAPTSNPIPVNLQVVVELVRQFLGPFFPGLNGSGNVNEFSAMKGPMTTQTLRGMVNHGHMHWRGDRANGFFGVDDPNTNDSQLSFLNFIVAFEGLVGDERPPTDPELQAEMQMFTDFALELTLPPNPVRALDNTLTAAQASGREFYFGGPDGTQLSDGVALVPGVTGFTCNGCHVLDPAQGFFGTDGSASFELEQQILKIPHLRNVYQKVGMFGMAFDPNFFLPGDNEHQGEQVRGFGFLHDGSTDTLFRFFRSIVFDPATFGDAIPGVPGGGFTEGDPQRRDMEEFVLAFDSDLAPIVGQQVTLTRRNAAAAGPRIDLLLARSDTPFESKILGEGARECDVIVKGRLAGQTRGWLHTGEGAFMGDDGAATTDTELRRLAARTPLTYTCAPPGSGHRMGIDRDDDGVLDALDNCPAVSNAGQDDGDLCND
jgi:YVTN family beta-propeller protein